jgi:hypothetical protein
MAGQVSLIIWTAGPPKRWVSGPGPLSTGACCHSDLCERNRARHYKLSKQVKVPDFRPDLKMGAIIPVIEGTELVLVTAIREIRDAIA